MNKLAPRLAAIALGCAALAGGVTFAQNSTDRSTQQPTAVQPVPGPTTSGSTTTGSPGMDRSAASTSGSTTMDGANTTGTPARMNRSDRDARTNGTNSMGSTDRSGTTMTDGTAPAPRADRN
jgi:hypothetical protein